MSFGQPKQNVNSTPTRLEKTVVCLEHTKLVHQEVDPQSVVDIRRTCRLACIQVSFKDRRESPAHVCFPCGKNIPMSQVVPDPLPRCSSSTRDFYNEEPKVKHRPHDWNTFVMTVLCVLLACLPPVILLAYCCVKKTCYSNYRSYSVNL